MQIVSNTGGIASTNSYLVIDDATRQCVLFDAPDHTVEPLLKLVEKDNLTLLGLWLTHGHFDHLADHKIVTDAFPDAEVFIHRLDVEKLLKPGSRMFQLPFEIPPGKPNAYLEDGQILSIGDIKLKVIATPGHSPGHVSFYFEKEKVLIGGDLIIGGAVGRTDLPDSNPDDLDASLRKVMQLPPETQLLPGHGEPSLLSDEAALNPYVKRAMRT